VVAQKTICYNICYQFEIFQRRQKFRRANFADVMILWPPNRIDKITARCRSHR